MSNDRVIEVLELEIKEFKAEVEKYKEFGNVVWNDLVETQQKYAQLRLYALAALEALEVVDESSDAQLSAVIRMLERGLGMREPSPLVDMLKPKNLPFGDQSNEADKTETDNLKSEVDALKADMKGKIDWLNGKIERLNDVIQTGDDRYLD